MPQRKDYKGLDKFALLVVGEKNISNSSPREGALEAVMQYWGSQSNIAVVFATILSSISIALFLELEELTRWVSLPFFFAFLYFALRAWAFGRCARIACGLWK